MGEIRVEEEVDAKPETVWALVREFGGVKEWNDGIDSCEVDGSGIGAVRTLKMGGIEIQERLEHIDDTGRTFSYSIISGPVPVENYLASMTIHDAAEGKARVTWQGSFDPKGVAEEDCAKLFTGVYQGGIAAIRKAVT
ncbi:MAG: SRPBCC family protein [Candidatus Binatia bacterium]|nr:SRPBCC family protein [Candidatus Binatia bacterium]